MIQLKSLLLWCLALGLWCIREGSTNGLTKTCECSDFVVKCCPKNQIMRVTYDRDDNEILNCVDSQELAKNHSVLTNVTFEDFSHISVYNNDVIIKSDVIKTNKNANDFTFKYVANFIDNNNCMSEEQIERENYLLEDGKWILRSRKRNKWSEFEPGQFCIEHEVSVYEGRLESSTPALMVCVAKSSKTSPSTSNRRAITTAYGLIVSCVFLVLVLAVYALLPELRNLAGLILMACMATYFAFFFIRVIHVFGFVTGILSANACVTLTIIFYYFTLATFCWMNVMSFDIWWTFRGICKSSRIHRRSEMCKFRWYCAYAWGLPVLPTLFVIIIDRQDLSHMPSFVQPRLYSQCYFGPKVQMLYVCIPMGILISINFILFLMTAFNIWQVKRRVDQYKDSANNRDESYRFWVYVRLSLLMGVSWVLEVVGNLVDVESVFWSIADLYNALMGLFIFLLFVCKKKTLLRLCDRLSINNKLVEYMRVRTEDSRAADAHTKSSNNIHTDTSDVEQGPSNKAKKNSSEDI